MAKLNPSYYMRRALRAKTPAEWIEAQQGLMWYYNTRWSYIVDNYLKAFKRIGGLNETSK